MKILISKEDLTRGSTGLVIGVEGFKGNPADAEGINEQIYIEYWDGKIRVHVWNGSQDAKTLEIDRIEG